MIPLGQSLQEELLKFYLTHSAMPGDGHFDKSESAPDKHVQFDEGKEHDNEGEKFVEIKGDITIYLESEEKEVFAGTTSEEVLKPSEVVEPPETKSDEVDDDSVETCIKVIEEVSGVEEEDI